ncbi:hypothetical protein EP331_00725, partial [bacterium]
MPKHLIAKLKKALVKNEMIKTSVWTGIGTIIAQLSGIVVAKIVAVTIGPSGVAYISQFQNFIGITTNVATGGIQQGVVKYVAEFNDDIEEKAKVLSTSIIVTISTAFIISALIFLFRESLGEYL